MKIYYAAALFTQHERIWNRHLAAAVERQLPGWEVLLPQNFKVDEQYNKKTHYKQLFESCTQGIREADCVVAIVDGCDADSGTSFEIGFAYALNIPVIGVRTDFRENQERGVNLMISRACTQFISDPSFSEDVVQLSKNIAKRIKMIFKDKQKK